MSASSSSSTTTYEVQLAIYDLSHGMARQLSTQFLGPNHTIDIIPHTAILAYGLEYYFGNGIESCSPAQFRQSKQIYPIDIVTLGHTFLSREEFESWCRNVGNRDGMYSPQSYDLISRNCNNFSYDAATQGLRLSDNVFPKWILDVPQRFLSSPMGMMVRPILEGMQVTGGGGSAAPFAGASGNANQFASLSSQRVGGAATSISTGGDDNPWANIPSKQQQQQQEKQQTITKDVSSKQDASVITTPTLNSYNRYLLSDDVAVVPICISKINKHITKEEEKMWMERLGQILTTKTTTTVQEEEEEEILSASSHLLLEFISGEKSKNGNAAFALMLLRLVVLHSSCDTKVLARIVQVVKMTTTNNSSAAIQSMSWCVLSNVISKCDSSSSLTTFFSCKENNADGSDDNDEVTLESLIDAAILDTSSSSSTNTQTRRRVEVRQSASAFLYNVAHYFALEKKQKQLLNKEEEEEELSDVMVLLLCGSLENILEEEDGTVKLRRLLVAAKMLHSDSSRDGVVGNNQKEEKENQSEVMIKTLAIDLGFCDVVETLAEQKFEGECNKKDDDDKKVVQLAKEIRSIL